MHRNLHLLSAHDAQTAILTYSNVLAIDEDLGKNLGSADRGHSVALLDFDGAVNLSEGNVLGVQQILDRSDVLLGGQHTSRRGRVKNDFTRHGYEKSRDWTDSKKHQAVFLFSLCSEHFTIQLHPAFFIFLEI